MIADPFFIDESLKAIANERAIVMAALHKIETLASNCDSDCDAMENALSEIVTIARKAQK